MTETKNDDYKRGYREGFLDGFHAARDNESLMSPNIPIPSLSIKCKECGINFGAGPMGYTCRRPMCPMIATAYTRGQHEDI